MGLVLFVNSTNRSRSPPSTTGSSRDARALAGKGGVASTTCVVVNPSIAGPTRLRILWAHAGLTEAPERVSQLLDAQVNLWTEISFREFEIAPRGQLDESWRRAFLRHPDRFMIGSDTYVNGRWQQYGDILAFDRRWLDQLPRTIAEAIAFRNAARVFDLALPAVGN